MSFKKGKQWDYKPGSVPGTRHRLTRTPKAQAFVIYPDRISLCGSSVLPSNSGEPPFQDKTPMLDAYTTCLCIGILELAASKMHSQCVATLLVSSYFTFSPLPSGPHRRKRGGHFLLHYSILTNCFYIRKWIALCCPDFPLALRQPSVEKAWQKASDKLSYCFPNAKLGKITQKNKFFLPFQDLYVLLYLI